MKVLLTGASGFLGSALSKQLVSCKKYQIRSFARRVFMFPGVESFVGELDAPSAVGDAVRGADVVVHCAARAHVMDDSVQDPLAEYRKVNVEGTRCLAEHAAAAGVKRFVFLSSIKVNGESTGPEPYRYVDEPLPEDAYGQSKLEAEQVLWKIGLHTGMEIVIIRPPLVYGPKVKGNFAMLIRAVSNGLPLPLGAVNNLRSLVALDNLVDLIITCIDHPAAANQTFLVSDDDDVSTTELLRRMAKAFGKKQLLIPVPKWAMALPAKLLGKQSAVDRLFGSLQVNIMHTKEMLNWKPPVTMEEQLLKIAASLIEK